MKTSILQLFLKRLDHGIAQLLRGYFCSDLCVIVLGIVWYELHGDDHLPCLTVPSEEQRPIGVWGQRHLRYIKQHHKSLYTELLTSGKLTCYLADLNEQAETMFFELVKQLAAREGVTEQLKAQDQMLWIQRMNNIRDRAMEVVNST